MNARLHAKCAGAPHFRAGMNMELIGWISGKLQIRKPHTINHHLIGADGDWRRETLSGGIRHVVILIHAVAAHTKSPDKNAILIERKTARKRLRRSGLGWRVAILDCKDVRGR